MKECRLSGFTRGQGFEPQISDPEVVSFPSDDAPGRAACRLGRRPAKTLDMPLVWVYNVVSPFALFVVLGGCPGKQRGHFASSGHAYLAPHP